MARPDTIAIRAYSIEDVAAALTISRRTAYRLIAARKLRTVKFGGRRLVPAGEIERLLEPAMSARSEFANGEDSQSRACGLAAPPEKPQAPGEQPERLTLSELLARVG